MFTKRELKEFLEQISENAAFIKFQFFSSDKFQVQLRCKVNGEETTERYNKFAAEWIKKFAKFTATTWIVRSSFPKIKRLLYRKVFSCHRSSFNKKKECTEETRNQGCRAKIDFKMKITSRHTLKKDPLLKDGLNMTIYIDFTHTHKLRTQEAFNLLKSTPETDQIIYDYFDNGYTPAISKSYHELTVVDRYGDQPQYLMNANINPTVSHFHYLYKKRQKTSEAEVTKTFEDIMSSKKTTLESAGGFLNYDNPEVVCVITPTMRRVISSLSLDHILMDSIPITGGPVVTFLYAVSKAGALPIACLLHTEENEANYSQAFLSIKLSLENLLHGQFEPKLLNIKDCKEVRDAATSIFPNSIVLSSKWSVCCNVWQWICSDNLKLDVEKQRVLLENFCEMIRCNSLELAQSTYELYKEDEPSSDVTDYLEELWKRRVHWLNGEDHVSMNVVEASMRVMNEFVHQKCKSFNIQLMVDVTINIIDNQIRRILHAHVKGLNLPSTYTKYLEKTKDVMNFDSNLKRIDSTEFKLKCALKSRRYVTFWTDHWCCDCAVGKKGRFCEHLCAAINVVDTDLMKTDELTDEEKCLLREIAGAELEEKRLVKPEAFEQDDQDEMEIIDEKEDDGMNHDDNVKNGEDDVDRCSMSSPKSDDGDGYYYMDVKMEDCDGDPLYESTEISNDERCAEISELTYPSQNKNDITTSKVNLKSQYEGAMRALNSEFKRLNKYFKRNPNKSNMDTMVRLARELGKIRPIERIDLGNMHIQLNGPDDNQS